MEDGLKIGKTLDLPFCFTPGAFSIKSAFVEQAIAEGSAIEIGVFVQCWLNSFSMACNQVFDIDTQALLSLNFPESCFPFPSFSLYPTPYI